MFEFRRYKNKQGNKQVKHPKLIVDETDNEYGFMGLTSSRYKGRGHKNITLIDNPQFIKGKRLSHVSYLRRKIEYDKKENFEEPLSNYSLSKIDKMFIKDYVSRKLKKK